ncbi:MAG: iron-containing alcohol dehydrogenase [Desulfobacterales bacterium]
MMKQFNFPTTIYFGEGSLCSLAERVKARNHQKILIITDKTLVELGLLTELTKELAYQDLDFEIFDDTHPNPTEEDVKKGTGTYAQAGCDSLIAFGGGSPMDVAKAIKIMASHPEPMEQYDDAKGGDRLIVNPMPPLYAVPTTAGTGSEVGRSGVIIMKKTGEKTIFFHPQLMPDIAVLEPKLTTGLPASITAATGIDALIHNLEAFFSPGFHPMADGIALEGIKLVIKYLPVVCRNGSDLEARSKMLIAASMGATAFQKGLGMIHSLAHPLSSHFNLHHGQATALLTPSALAFLEKKRLSKEHKERFGAILHLYREGGIAEESLSETCYAFIESLGIELGLANHSISESDLDVLADAAFHDPCHATNIVPVSRNDLLQIYRAAL